MYNIISSTLIWMLKFAVGLVVGVTITMLGVIFLGDYAILVVIALVATSVIGYSLAD